MLVFFDEKKSEGELITVKLIEPLVFLNFLYHEFDLIVKSQLQPIECLNRIRNIDIIPLLRVYFLHCLEQLLIKSNVVFIPDRLVKDRIEAFKNIDSKKQ